MFLWCGCHCGPDSASEPPSVIGSSIIGSIPSQENGSPSVGPPPEPPIAIVPCLACLFGVAPQVYEFEWDYGGQSVKAFPPRPCCSFYSGQKKYRLYARMTVPGECLWSSNEKMKKRVVQPPFGTTATCEDGLGSRVALSMKISNTNRPLIFLSVYYLEGDLVAQPVNPIKEANYVLVNALGSPINNPGDKIACLQQLRFRALWSLENRPAVWLGSYNRQGLPYGSPCDQVSFSMIDPGLPEYVTCTPVPA